MATQSIPMAPPAAERSGPIGWMRRHLFATPFDTVLTLLVVAILALLIPPLFRWAVLNANLTATNRTECPVDGACWALIPSRFHQYLFGLYPVDQYWRVILGGILLLVGCIPLFVTNFPRKALYGLCFAILYPIVAAWLFAGGGPLQPTVDTNLWGGLFLTLVISIVGIVASFPIGIVLALGRRSNMPVVKALCVSFIELVRGVPLVTVSGLAGEGIDRLMEACIRAAEIWGRRVSTASLNRWLEGAISAHPPPAVSGRRIKIRYMTQPKSRPPYFALFGNQLDSLPESYNRYLVNGLRETFELAGVPIRLSMRTSANPYDKRKKR